MLTSTEKTFKDDVLASTKPTLVFFYRESGCSFCDKMKPILAEYALAHPEVNTVKYALGQSPDSINAEYPIERFPTYYAFKDGVVVGKQEGAMSIEQLHLTFTPELLNQQPQASEQITIDKATLLQLLTEEANLIDIIAGLKMKYQALKSEINRRRDSVKGWE